MDGCDYETYPNLQSEKGEKKKKDTGNYCFVNITSRHNNYVNMYTYVAHIFL